MDWPESLSSERRQLLEISLQELAAHPGIPYKYSAASPEQGGMDCSGAVYYLLQKVGITPPRSSAAQYAWVKASGKLVTVPAGARTLDDPAFAQLQPGDLLFWAHDAPDIATNPKVSHVQIYLGKESKDGFAIMIGSSDGRSYRGARQNGFSIVDFQIPKAGSYKPLVAYGPPVWKK